MKHQNTSFQFNQQQYKGGWICLAITIENGLLTFTLPEVELQQCFLLADSQFNIFWNYHS